MIAINSHTLYLIKVAQSYLIDKASNIKSVFFFNP